MSMKMIEFYKDESIKDNVTLSVNGKLHTIRHKSSEIQTNDENPLTVIYLAIKGKVLIIRKVNNGNE